LKTTVHLRISGAVQGVGYRHALRAQALRRGLSGWVRNRADGSVEAVLQGSPEDVDAVTAWARRGPPAARVTGVEARPATGGLDRDYRGFAQLPSA
jgi:acylphosphatase